MGSDAPQAMPRRAVVDAAAQIAVCLAAYRADQGAPGPGDDEWEQIVEEEITSGRSVFFGSASLQTSRCARLVCANPNCLDAVLALLLGRGDERTRRLVLSNPGCGPQVLSAVAGRWWPAVGAAAKRSAPEGNSIGWRSTRQVVASHRALTADMAERAFSRDSDLRVRLAALEHPAQRESVIAAAAEPKDILLGRLVAGARGAAPSCGRFETARSAQRQLGQVMAGGYSVAALLTHPAFPEQFLRALVRGEADAASRAAALARVTAPPPYPGARLCRFLGAARPSGIHRRASVCAGWVL